jgi:hypothetical protein
MRRVTTSRLLMAMAVTPLVLLAGCAPVEALQKAILGGLGSGSATTTVIVCPVLELPPEPAIAALEQSSDPAVAEWANELDQHYDQLASCRR